VRPHQARARAPAGLGRHLHWGATVTAPTLILSGASDRLPPPANGLLLAHMLPNSRLHTLDGEGHLLLFDPQSAAYPLLEGFFAADDHVVSPAWRPGREVTDAGEVRAALKAAHGTPLVKPLAALY